MEEQENERCSDSKWQFKRAIFQEGEKPAPPPPAPPAEGGPSAVHFDFMRCLQTCRLQWFQLWWLQFPFGLGQVLLVLLLLWLEHMAVHLQALSKKTSWCTKWPGLSCTSTWSYFSYWFFIWLLTFGPFHAAFMQLSYSGLRFCWEVQQEWAGGILQWDSWWMVLWQANSSFCPADVFVLYKDNDLVCHFSSYSFKEVWSTGYLQQWQQAMMMVAWQKRRGWWHDAGRGRFAMPAMPLRSCPAECEARCMDLPRGLMCFHLRYMLFFVLFFLGIFEIARKIAKDHERCGTCLEITRFVFFRTLLRRDAPPGRQIQGAKVRPRHTARAFVLRGGNILHESFHEKLSLSDKATPAAPAPAPPVSSACCWVTYHFMDPWSVDSPGKWKVHISAWQSDSW